VKRVKLDFDWKREPDVVSTREIQGTPHLAFTTKPCDDIDTFQKARADWDSFSRHSHRCLKTTDDLAAFRIYRATAQLAGQGVRRSIDNDPLRPVVLQIARAFVRGDWGLNNNMSRREFIEFMKAGGYEVTPSDLKNATRAKLVPHSIDKTPEIERLCQVLKGKFPRFREDLLLVQI